MATSSATIPSTLAFLVSNFHSLVNIKLDGSNFLLWKTQVENVLNANGYLGYINGTEACPSVQIRDPSGNMVTNPDFTLWKLIDSQLLACLTASLSQNTLPYVLGLHRSSEVWLSLNNRYNSISRTHIHELRCKLYSLTKDSTMESYIDTIKTYAQQLAASGGPLSDEDLIFHTLHGLPPVYNGFKTGIRTRGDTSLTFEELVTMLSGEDLQLSQDSSRIVDSASVLVASHNTSGPNSTPIQSPVNHMPSSSVSQNFPQTFSYTPQNLPMLPSQYQQQVYQTTYQNSNRGRGRGSRFPRDPCIFCGKTNHAPQYCYYRGQASAYGPIGSPQILPNGQMGTPVRQQFSHSLPPVNQWQPQQFSHSLPPVNQWQPQQFPQNQWRGYSAPAVSPSLYTSQGFDMPQSGVPMFSQSGMSMTPQPGPLQIPQFGVATGKYVNPGNQGYAQAHFTGTFGNIVNPGSQGCAQAQFTGVSDGLLSTPGFSASTSSSHPGGYNLSVMNSEGQSIGTSSAQGSPWYFDSGATSHITNNLQNIAQPQPTHAHGGVQVGNGSQLQVMHSGSGQGFPSNSVQGTMQQGVVSSTELL